MSFFDSLPRHHIPGLHCITFRERLTLNFPTAARRLGKIASLFTRSH